MQSAQVLEALKSVVRRYVSLKLQGTCLTKNDLVAILTYPAIHQATLQAACAEAAT